MRGGAETLAFRQLDISPTLMSAATPGRDLQRLRLERDSMADRTESLAS
jgi:hypothetical protein